MVAPTRDEVLDVIAEAKERKRKLNQIIKEGMASLGGDAKELERIRKAEVSRNRYRNNSDIAGLIPEISNPELRESTADNLLKWHTDVFPNSTGLRPFGDVQVNSVELMQSGLIHGGKTAVAEPRGYGKTTRVCNSALWAVVTGRRRFVVIIGSSLDKAKEIMEDIQTELENEILQAMYPEVFVPFALLDGNAQRGPHQRYEGALTGLKLTKDKIVFPRIPGSKAAGAVVMVRPMTNVRGIHHRLKDGTVLRPDFVILDDIQDDKTANSPTSIEKTLETIKKSVLKLGGHSKTLACVMNCTVIQPDDASDQTLEDPAWQAIRYMMLPSRSNNEAMWLGEYAELRQSFSKGDPESQHRARKRSMEFYIANREAMDDGAEASWEWAYAWDDEDPTEISAVQHAYNFLIDDGESAFMSECQNQPLRSTVSSFELMTVDEIAAKQSHTKRLEVPSGRDRIVAAFDVQPKSLVWAVGAFDEKMTGTVIDYGLWPERRSIGVKYRRGGKGSLQDKYRQYESLEEQIYAGLHECFEFLSEREYVREDGAVLPLSKVFCDRGFETDTIDLFCLNNAIVHGCKGAPLGPGDLPLPERKPKDGEKNGDNWQYKQSPKNKKVMYYFIDGNHWKTQVHRAFQVGTGGDGSLDFFKGKTSEHKIVGQHCHAEYPETVDGVYREFEVWHEKTGRPVNDMFDVLTYLLVCASSSGASRPVKTLPKHRPKIRRRSMQDRIDAAKA